MQHVGLFANWGEIWFACRREFLLLRSSLYHISARENWIWKSKQNTQNPIRVPD
jgi:hypothetical protein